jgi:outer membrane lipoprotein LolB
VWNLEAVKSRRGFGAGLVATLWLVSGCASLRPVSQDATWTTGRLSVRIEASPQRIAQSISAAFELRGDAQAESGELRLNSPLGNRLATAIWAPGVARLITPEGEQSFASLDDLSRQALGENLPLVALPSWIQGRPWTGAAHQVGGDGFDQLGWQINTRQQAEGRIEARRAASATAPAVWVRALLDVPA